MLDLMAYRDREFPADQPELHVLMQAVQEFPIEPPDCPEEEVKLRGLRNTWANNYSKFWNDLQKLDVEWLQFKAKRMNPHQAPTTALSEWTKGPCPVCNREADDPDTLAALARAEKWLEEHGNE